MADPSTESSWCEISVPQFQRNVANAQALLPLNTRLCAVVKADAYGHGIANVVPSLMKQDVSHIGISSNREAQAVRDAGFTGVILRLRTATLEEIRLARDCDVEEMIGSLDSLQSLVRILGTNGLPRVHVALNSGGMSRDGLELSSWGGREDCLQILEQAGTQVTGLCTHFPSNTPPELTQSITRFHSDMSWIFANSGLRREAVLVHAGSTLTLASGLDPKTDMMRCGAILYGIAGPRPNFDTTLALKSRVVSIGRYPKGSTIGYDRTTRLNEDRVLASVALGYANGYCRELSGRGRLLIRGRSVPVMGKVSMNTIVADVTGLPNLEIGDEVVAFGRQENQAITSHDMEQATGTIMADLFTDWGQRNPRVVHTG